MYSINQALFFIARQLLSDATLASIFHFIKALSTQYQHVIPQLQSVFALTGQDSLPITRTGLAIVAHAMDDPAFLFLPGHICRYLKSAAEDYGFQKQVEALLSQLNIIEHGYKKPFLYLEPNYIELVDFLVSQAQTFEVQQKLQTLLGKPPAQNSSPETTFYLTSLFLKEFTKDQSNSPTLRFDWFMILESHIKLLIKNQCDIDALLLIQEFCKDRRLLDTNRADMVTINKAVAKSLDTIFSLLLQRYEELAPAISEPSRTPWQNILKKLTLRAFSLKILPTDMKIWQQLNEFLPIQEMLRWELYNSFQNRNSLLYAAHLPFSVVTFTQLVVKYQVSADDVSPLVQFLSTLGLYYIDTGISTDILAQYQAKALLYLLDTDQILNKRQLEIIAQHKPLLLAYIEKALPEEQKRFLLERIQPDHYCESSSDMLHQVFHTRRGFLKPTATKPKSVLGRTAQLLQQHSALYTHSMGPNQDRVPGANSSTVATQGPSPTYRAT